MKQGFWPVHDVLAMFHGHLTANDLSGVSITDGDGNPVQNVEASVIGSSLQIGHDDFAPNTDYTVAIPPSSIKTGDFGNNEESWTFTTATWTKVVETENISIEIFPNPIDDFIKVKCQKEGIYRICTLSGKEVASGIIINSNNIIYINNLSHGIYLLQIKIGNQIIHKKIIIQ